MRSNRSHLGWGLNWAALVSALLVLIITAFASPAMANDQKEDGQTDLDEGADVGHSLDAAREIARQARFWRQQLASPEAKKRVTTCFPDANQSELDEALKSFDAAQAAEKPGSEKTEKAASTLRVAIEKLTARSPSIDGFQRYLESPAQRQACSTLRDEVVSFENDGTVVKKEEQKYEAKATQAAVQSRTLDLLRKASPLTTALGSGNGLLEASGAPDRAIFSVMGALGAEQETNGTQVVMTLGLANLFGWSDAERLKQPAAARNLFLRASLPLSATQAEPVAGGPTDAAAATDEADGAKKDVGRMSFTLGTSLYDQSDPRLDGTPESKESNRDCFRHVLAYRWNSLSQADEAARAAERRPDFDECSHRAAERQRFGVRAGVGLILEDEKTKVETFGAALVWAPASWLYLNGLYQRLLLPDPRHSFGGGLSFGANLGGSPSGVDAWARIGFDTLVLGVVEDGKPAETEVRLQITGKFKLANNIVTAAIGPRLLGDGLTNPGVLASVALSYDADELFGPLLAAPAAAPAGRP